MKKIETLGELRTILSGLLVTAKSLKRSEWDSKKNKRKYEVPDSEPCVTVFVDGILMVCWRRLKPEGSTEVFRLTKIDRAEGPTPKRSTFYLVKMASFLEKRDLYVHRETISDETDEISFTD